jgi:Trypsin-co-occurring domain 1
MSERGGNIVVGNIGGMKFAIAGSPDAVIGLNGTSPDTSDGITLTSTGGSIPQSIATNAQDLVAMSSAMLEAWSEHWKSITAGANAPDEVSVTLNLGFEASAGIWFVSGTGSGGVEISMSWSRRGSAQ